MNKKIRKTCEVDGCYHRASHKRFILVDSPVSYADSQHAIGRSGWEYLCNEHWLEQKKYAALVDEHYHQLDLMEEKNKQRRWLPETKEMQP